MATPLCPDCRKQMTVRYICTHCGYDTQRIQTTTHRKVASTPYTCVKCNSPTGKLVDKIPVCGDCFVAGWGRLPDMPLEKSVAAPTPINPDAVSGGAKEYPLQIPDESALPKDFPCPKCRRKFSTKTGLGIHKKSKHGGK